MRSENREARADFTEDTFVHSSVRSSGIKVAAAIMPAHVSNCQVHVMNRVLELELNGAVAVPDHSP